MTTLLFVLPWVASVCGALMIGKALQLWELDPHGGENRKRLAAALCLLALFPAVGHAQAADLHTAVSSGNAIIMYLSGTLAAAMGPSAGSSTAASRKKM